MARVKLFFDGGCRPNPGAIEVAVVAAGRTTIRTDLGHGTSADAEWLALIEALTVARAQGLKDYVLMGDALAVIAQANGTARCPAANVAHRDRFRALAADGTAPRIRYVKRAQNLAGIELARLHPR